MTQVDTTPSSSPATAHPADGAAAFDFLHGRWTVHNRRLIGRLCGSTRWERFESSTVTRPLPGGIGNLEEYRSEHWPEFVGLALRTYEAASDTWSIHWIDNRGQRLEPPVHGRFDGDQGLFEGDDQLDGRTVRVRFIWSRGDADTPRWEQAFSDDGGRSWETNWTMEFRRAH